MHISVFNFSFFVHELNPRYFTFTFLPGIPLPVNLTHFSPTEVPRVHVTPGLRLKSIKSPCEYRLTQRGFTSFKTCCCRIVS